MNIAGVVLYNPDLDRLKSNIDGIVTQVDLIYCVDNGSENISDIEQMLLGNNKTILHKNGENRGIAIALNQMASFALCKGAEWILTLDQDSIPQPGLIEAYDKALRGFSSAGMLTCIIKDRNTQEVSEVVGDNCVVDNCITSGSYLNLRAWKEVGGFDEKMFIDYVDFDICQMLHEAGYRIYRINHYGLLHEVGSSKVVHFFGKEETIYGHSAFRKYYIIRNHIYYARKHQKYINKWKEFGRVVKFMLLVIIYEDNKWNKLKRMLLGVYDSIRM